MAAPLLTYSDSRLYGTSLTYPLNRVLQLYRGDPIMQHPTTIAISELTLYFFAHFVILFTFLNVFLWFSIPSFLIGKCIQVIHYHTLPSHPTAVKVHGVALPLLKRHSKESIPCSSGFIVTDASTSLYMFYYGIDSSRTTMGTVVEFQRRYFPGHLVKVFFKPNIPKSQFAVVSAPSMQKLQLDIKRKWKHLTPEEKDNAFRDLFLHNGYQALKIEREDKFYLYDPTYIHFIAYRF